MSYSGDPGMEVLVLIVLCTEILLVPLTLLQTGYSAVCATRIDKTNQLGSVPAVLCSIIKMFFF